MLPTLFLSHGAPSLPLTQAPAKQFLAALPGHLDERPSAILIVSAHWETTVPTVNATGINATIHDFGGFAAQLSQIQYPAPGSVQLAERVGDLLAAEGLPCRMDEARGLDHGAWVPLLLMYPKADVPVVQLSVQGRLGPAHHLAVGRALLALRHEGVLVIGSGSLTHDLSEFGSRRDEVDAPEPGWVAAFAAWIDAALVKGSTRELLAYRRLAPYAVKNHPSEEHLLPLFVALGAAGPGAKARRHHASVTHGVLRMDVYAFGDGASG